MKSYFEEQAEKYLVKQGWKFHFPYKIRGMQPDFIVEKDGKLAVIEVKGERADLDNGIKKALHFKNAANYSYLAIPDFVITGKVVDICKGLGIGLIAIDIESKEIVKPESTKALESVKNKIFQKIQEKPKIKKKGLLETLFRSKTFVYVLNYLFLNQTKEYYLNELASETGISAATIVRELAKIKSLNIVTKTKKGYTSYYRINRNCIIYEELKRIFLKFELTDDIIEYELRPYDIKFALIYGSFARGTETETSDMDLLIIGNADKIIILKTISKLETKIGREVNHILWSESQFKEKIKQGISLLENIKENEIVMIKGREAEFKQIIK